MENVVHALERPSADRKYKKVDNDGNNEEKGSNNAFQKMISTPAQLARKVVSKTSDSVNKKAANDVVQNKLRKIGSSSNAIADEEKTITVDVGDNDGTDTIMPELAPEGTDNNGTDANAASTTSTTVESAPALLDEPLGIFERPSTHRKYHKIERDSDSGENRLSKVASDAAQRLSAGATRTKDIASKAVGNIANRVRTFSSDSDAVDVDATHDELPHPSSGKTTIQNAADDEDSTTHAAAAEKVAVDEAVPPPPIGSPMDGIKHIMRGTNEILGNAKSKLVPSKKKAPKKEESNKTVNAVVTDNTSSDSVTTAANVYSKTVHWSRNTYHKTTKGLNRALGRNKPQKKVDRTMMSSVRSDITMDDTTMDNDTATDDDSSHILEILVTPRLEFWLHDVTVAMCILSVIAAVPTLSNWRRIVVHQELPGTIILVWLLCAFCAGMEIGRYRGMRSIPGVGHKGGDDESVGDSTIGASGSSKWEERTRSTRPPSHVNIPYAEKAEKEVEAPCHEGFALIVSLIQLFWNVRLKYVQDAHDAVKAAILHGTTVAQDAVMSAQFWSTLNHANSREAWEQVGFIKVSDPLMQRLLRNPDYERRSLKAILEEQQKNEALLALEESPERSISILGHRMGTFDISQCDATTLDGLVVDPIFKLRGMDVFLTDDPETSMATHPFLMKQGLRDVASVVANVMVQWGNILIYFELPEWFTEYQSAEEYEDDANDVKALKRFINGDDDYKNERLKILPCLMDGPMPVRIIAPPKRELTINSSRLPKKWIRHDTETTPGGRVLKPCIEIEFDIVSNKTLRSVTSMLTRYVQSISLDLALIVDKPTPESEDEPSACLAMWRFDHIDIANCPKMPPRTTVDEPSCCDNSTAELRADVRRASLIANISTEELATITKGESE